VTLRRYADELKSRPNLSLLNYIEECIQADFNLEAAGQEFLRYYLESAQSILLFDGMDELPSPHFKQTIRNRISALATTYPGNTIIVTTRIVGYDNPFRFDADEVRHYRLTKLQLPEMEKFVNDWYSARIENQREREQSVEDLVRILQDENHTAIRELAENPLLLTIVALVHRIDAVLPDERVVLYQKCTETLLNTWHTWKFREADAKNRGKVERRNRYRMEAIAHWMHCRSLSPGRGQRAVVSYSDLLDFLSRHISENEKPDSDSEPEDLAKEFLDFVKKRAGLLIEVGDNQYSFVHLTFQEYLTSAHIITTSEKAGAHELWKTIHAHYSEPRWHEVIRLLIAGLKSNETQRFLIEKVFSTKSAGSDVTRSQVLGGLLVDGIEPAQEHAQEILSYLIAAGRKVDEIDQLRTITSMLRSWLLKGPANEGLLSSTFKSLGTSRKNSAERGNTALLLSCINLPPPTISKLNDALRPKKDIAFREMDFFFDDQARQLIDDSLKAKIDLCRALNDVFVLTSATRNFVGATNLSVLAPLGNEELMRAVFEQQLVALASKYSGPFSDLTMNILLVADNRDSAVHHWVATQHERSAANRNRLSAFLRTLQSIRGRHRISTQKNRGKVKRPRESDPARYLARARLRLLAGTRNRRLLSHKFMDHESGTSATALSRLRRELRKREPRSVGDQENGQSLFWQGVLTTPSLYRPILDFILDTFSLEPRTQWFEALRIRFLATIPKQLMPFDQESWTEIASAFENNKFGKREVYTAASQMLMDAWLKVQGFYASKAPSLVERLAYLTSRIESPPLRIAHCIRDIAYGDEIRVGDLRTMVRSGEPDYRAIFERCFWQPTDT
jgi:hypothetical protein